MNLGEHVYIAFRLGGIISKLKTKWLLSKTSAFIVAFLFQGKRAHMLASEMKTACLIQVNLVNSPSPCLVQRNEAFCPGSVACLVPSTCDRQRFPSTLQPCPLVLARRSSPSQCSSWLPASARASTSLLLSGSIHSLQVVLLKCSI